MTRKPTAQRWGGLRCATAPEVNRTAGGSVRSSYSATPGRRSCSSREPDSTPSIRAWHRQCPRDCSASANGDRYLGTLMVPTRAQPEWDWEQAGSAKPLARQVAPAAASQCRGRCARQQECENRLGRAAGRHGLGACAVSDSSLNEALAKIIGEGGPTLQFQQMAEMEKRAPHRFPNLISGPAWR